MHSKYSLTNLIALGAAAGILKFRTGAQRRRKFDLAKISDDDAQKWFRFDKSHLERLRHTLRIPDLIKTEKRDRASGVVALCIVLRRLVYPIRLIESTQLLERSKSSLSRIFNHTVLFLHKEYRHLLEGKTNSWSLVNHNSKVTSTDTSRCFGFMN